MTGAFPYLPRKFVVDCYGALFAFHDGAISFAIKNKAKSWLSSRENTRRPSLRHVAVICGNGRVSSVDSPLSTEFI
jgi:hypothetical protein